jgi:phosphoglycerate kinase
MLLSIKIPFKSTVIIRVDYNIPEVSSIYRITITKKLILELLGEGFKVILLTHLGRPDKNENKLSSLNLIDTIEKEIGRRPEFIDQFTLGFKKTKSKIEEGRGFYILENTRFNSVEDSSDSKKKFELAKEYSTLGDYFIDEAFSVSHRQEATNFYIKKFLPWAYGYRYLVEVENLEKIRSPTENQRPLTIIMGGAKLETKLPVIKRLIGKVDKILIGGQLAFTFLQALNELEKSDIPIFSSVIEKDYLDEAKQLLIDYPNKIILPVDLVYCYDSKNKNIVGVDIGALTTQKFKNEINNSKTIFWNGPLGFVEHSPYDHSSMQILKTISNFGGLSILGGGDTEKIITTEFRDKLSFISSGGGACLEFLTKQ